jgi:hypothetical protein
MVTSSAKTVSAYLAALPPDRRAAVRTVRKTILEHLPSGYEEGMQYGMISYFIPLARYPVTYNGKPLAVASLAAHKCYLSLYLMSVYGDRKLERWFADAYRKSGKKLDVGKACVRFRTLEDLPLDVVGEAIARTPPDEFIAMYEASRKKSAGAARKPAAKKKGAHKPKRLA